MNVPATLNSNGPKLTNQNDLIIQQNDQMNGIPNQIQHQQQQQQQQQLILTQNNIPNQIGPNEISNVSRLTGPAPISATNNITTITTPLTSAMTTSTPTTSNQIPNQSTTSSAANSTRFRIVKTDSDRKSDSTEETVQTIPSNVNNINNNNLIQQPTQQQNEQITTNFNGQQTISYANPATLVNGTLNDPHNDTNRSNNNNNNNNHSQNMVNGYYQRGRWSVYDFLPENTQQQQQQLQQQQQQQQQLNVNLIPIKSNLNQPINQQQQQQIINDDLVNFQINQNTPVNSIDQSMLVKNSNNNSNIPPSSNPLTNSPLMNQQSHQQQQQQQPQQPQQQAPQVTMPAQNSNNNNFYPTNQIYSQPTQTQQPVTQNYQQNQIINQSINSSTASGNMITQNPQLIQPAPIQQSQPIQMNPINNNNSTIPSNTNNPNFVNIPQQSQPQPQSQTILVNNQTQQQVPVSQNQPQHQQPLIQTTIPNIATKSPQTQLNPMPTNTDNTQMFIQNPNTNYPTSQQVPVNSLSNQSINIMNNNTNNQQSQTILENLTVGPITNSNQNTSTINSTPSLQIPSQSSPKDQQIKTNLPQIQQQQQQQQPQPNNSLLPSLNIATLSATNLDNNSITLSNPKQPNDLDSISDLDSNRKILDYGIHNRIEEAMDIVKSHLTSAVKGEIIGLKSEITQLKEKNARLEQENLILKQNMPSETLRMLEQKGLIQQSNASVITNTVNTNINNNLGINSTDIDNSRISSQQDSMISSFTEHVVTKNNEILNIQTSNLNINDTISATLNEKKLGSNIE